MVSPAAGQRAHSARVEIELILEGLPAPRVVPVAQVGRDFVILAVPERIAPGFAQLVLRVDGRERRRRVRLAQPSDEASREITIASAG